MKVAVWDTYVSKKEGGRMHFDIITPAGIKETSVIYAFGRDYLAGKGQQEQPLTAKECSFCHIEQASGKMLQDIAAKGYHIIEMENC